MAHARALNILEDMKKVSSNIKLRNNSRLVELFEMTVTGNRNRLENAKTRMSAAEHKHKQITAQVANAQRRLTTVNEDLERVKNTCQQLESGVMLSSSNQQDIHEIKMALANKKKLLHFYKNTTGVRFDYNCDKESVSGCVLKKGHTPRESSLNPFLIDKASPHVQEEIWRKIQDTVEHKPIP